ncbi:hypothetical protein AAVH_21924 [Aphelenchoides avenae]|nr:hypothetical protein AAVH_21924 [Aphelenchus avenae]
MKWAARLSNHCVTDRDYADIGEEMADELELFVDRVINVEDASASFKRSVFDAHLLVAHLNFREGIYEHVRIRLKQLEDIAGEMETPSESLGVLKELKARVFVVIGRFGKASKLLRELLDEKAFLAVHPVRYPRICTQLRLLAQLVLSPAVFHEELDDIVDHIVGCYKTNDKAGLMAAMGDVADGVDSSALLDICNALVRNLTFRRMATDAWIDVFACLGRYDMDGALLVGGRLTTLVGAIAHRLQLRSITDVRLLGEIALDSFPHDLHGMCLTLLDYPPIIGKQRLTNAGVYRIEMSADKGRAPKCRDFAYDHLAARHADEWPFVGYLRCALAHSVIERFDLLGSLPTWCVGTHQANFRPPIYIQR